MRVWYILRRLLFLLILISLLTFSVPTNTTLVQKVRVFTPSIEFDYITWTLESVGLKFGQAGINPTQRLSPTQQHQVVIRYFQLISQLEGLQSQIQQIYSNPEVKQPAVIAKTELLELENLQKALQSLAPIAESILQAQVSTIVVEMEIAKLGDPIPPVLFHSTPLPKALIVSPRDQIKQEVNLSLLADLTIKQIAALESEVEMNTNSSALVVDVGGIGVYPTMVMRSSNQNWVFDVVAHEWAHNYLSLHPLGLNYDKTPELRTMNETTASIVGNEVSRELLRRFYPEFLASEPGSSKLAASKQASTPFDFRAEMHETRVRVEELLSGGEITRAEQYMEERRTVFVNQGYQIRKLNQAYFAFYGAYAEQPGGAAGEDPVGPAVRKLREQSPSLANFLATISKMNSFQQLQDAVADE